MPWPLDARSRFLIKGLFNEESRLARIDRMIFFWSGGFDLGGDTLRTILLRLGAKAAVGEGDCHLEIHHDAPRARVDELSEYLNEQDFETNSPSGLVFDDSGVQDWAFTALLHELLGEDPALVA